MRYSLQRMKGTWQQYDARHIVSEARSGNAEAQMAAVDRLEVVLDSSQKLFVLTTSDGYWARGESILDAAKGLVALRASRKAYVAGWLVLNDKKAGVDSMGWLCAEAQAIAFGLGSLGSLGGLLKESSRCAN